MNAWPLLIALAGCGSTDTPIVRAALGGSAALTITACAPTLQRAQLLSEALSDLGAHGTLVTAQGPGTAARLVINLCGGGGLAEMPPLPVAARRR